MIYDDDRWVLLGIRVPLVVWLFQVLGMATDRGCCKRLLLVAVTCGPGRMAFAGSTTCPLPG